MSCPCQQMILLYILKFTGISLTLKVMKHWVIRPSGWWNDRLVFVGLKIKLGGGGVLYCILMNTLYALRFDYWWAIEWLFWFLVMPARVESSMPVVTLPQVIHVTQQAGLWYQQRHNASTRPLILNLPSTMLLVTANLTGQWVSVNS